MKKADIIIMVWLTVLVTVFCFAAYIMYMNGEEFYCPCGETEINIKA